MNADALMFLADRGLSLDEIIEFARIQERKKDNTGAERQARHRAKKADESNALRNGVTDNSPPNDIYSNPQEITPETTNVVSPPKPKPIRKSPNGEPLPENWKPVLTAASQAIVDRWPPGWLDTQQAAFLDHAADKGRKSKDWQAAFRKWISNADEWTRQKNGATNQNRAGNIDRRSEIAKVLDRDIARDYRQAEQQRSGDDGGGSIRAITHIAASR